MSPSSSLSLSRTCSALRKSSAIVVIRSFAALSEDSSCSSALSSASSRSIATSRLAAEHSTPPRTPCALLSPSCSGLGLAPALLLLGHLVGSLLPATGVQLLAQVVARPFCLFASPALLGHPLVQRGLRHLPAGPLDAELLLGLYSGGPGLRPLRLLLDRLRLIPRL